MANVKEKVCWNEDQWIAACAHLIRCDSEDCRFCDRIKKQIQDERDTTEEPPHAQ